MAMVCACPAAAQNEQPVDTCGNIDPASESQCISRRVEQKERRLTGIYPKALASVRSSFRKYGNEDNRTDPKYLEQSQARWKLFIESDCAVQAAFGGGSNPSISRRELVCHEDALDARIKLLDQLADGSFGTG